ncbi:MAG: hypothetical protein GC164_10335 [Phycisphaera sp.]|nr:hypothetical protein [Phycisphaera sp.]
MLDRLSTHCMLKPADVEPRDARLKVVGAFNPGAVKFGQRVALVVRVVEEVVEQREGWVSSPRIDPYDGSLHVDWLRPEEQYLSDRRMYTSKKTGMCRLRFISHLRVYFSSDGVSIDGAGAVIEPRGEFETYGIEDPRITEIGGRFYMTYVAVSDRGVCTCLMSTTDFQSFERHGVILPPDNKDVVLFPEKIAGQYLCLHRPMPSFRISTPQVWLAQSDNLIRWGGHKRLLGTENSVRDRVGGGTPPIRTERGWLTIYHSNDRLPPDEKGNMRLAYTAGALLLDHHDPSKIIGHTPRPIIVPREPYETHGFVDNVIFPTGIVRRGDVYLVYNGAADENVCVIAYPVKALEESPLAGNGAKTAS